MGILHSVKREEKVVVKTRRPHQKGRNSLHLAGIPRGLRPALSAILARYRKENVTPTAPAKLIKTPWGCGSSYGGGR